MTFKNYFSRLSRRITCNSTVYKIYEKVLWNQIKDEKVPEHIGVILDGNRRWASEHSLPSYDGHKFGADKVEDLLNWCIDLVRFSGASWNESSLHQAPGRRAYGAGSGL